MTRRRPRRSTVDRAAAERAVDAFLRAIGRDPSSDPALSGTARAVSLAFIDEICDGYTKDPGAIVRESMVDGRSAVVALRDSPVATMCPHHLLPATGRGTIAFAPREKLVGIGALASLLDAFAHRLILQEEIGERVVATLAAELGVRWVACRLVLQHACLTARGERKHGAAVETVAIGGDPKLREEALFAVRGGA